MPLLSNPDELYLPHAASPLQSLLSSNSVFAAGQPRARGGGLRQDRELGPHRQSRDRIQQERWARARKWCDII